MGSEHRKQQCHHKYDLDDGADYFLDHRGFLPPRLAKTGPGSFISIRDLLLLTLTDENRKSDGENLYTVKIFPDSSDGMPINFFKNSF